MKPQLVRSCGLNAPVKRKIEPNVVKSGPQITVRIVIKPMLFPDCILMLNIPWAFIDNNLPCTLPECFSKAFIGYYLHDFIICQFIFTRIVFIQIDT